MLVHRRELVIYEFIIKISGEILLEMLTYCSRHFDEPAS